MVYEWAHRLGGWLLPPTCLLCNGPGHKGLDLCRQCRGSLGENRPACRRCAEPLPTGTPPRSLCGHCTRREPPWDHLVAPWRYEEPLSGLIQRLKFSRELPAGRTLGLLLAAALPPPDPRPELLLPVPLHAGDLRRRGFNHAAEITRSLSRALEIPWSSRHLFKARPTATQHGLGRKARRRNLRDAFRFEPGENLEHVAVIDDVVTTGSTAAEIARTLKRAGVSRVSIWALARTAERHS